MGRFRGRRRARGGRRGFGANEGAGAVARGPGAALDAADAATALGLVWRPSLVFADAPPGPDAFHATASLGAGLEASGTLPEL